MSNTTTLAGTLLEIREAYIVLTGPTYIMLLPGMTVKDLVLGEALLVTVTSQGGRWTAQGIERAPA